jgi:acyl carrier protein
MNKSFTIEDRLRKIVVEQLMLDEDDVTPTARFVDDLGADSFDFVELVLAVEDEFDINIEDEEAETLVTFGDALAYVQKNVHSEKLRTRKQPDMGEYCKKGLDDAIRDLSNWTIDVSVVDEAAADLVAAAVDILRRARARVEKQAKDS